MILSYLCTRHEIVCSRKKWLHTHFPSNPSPPPSSFLPLPPPPSSFLPTLSLTHTHTYIHTYEHTHTHAHTHTLPSQFVLPMFSSHCTIVPADSHFIDTTTLSFFLFFSPQFVKITLKQLGLNLIVCMIDNCFWITQCLCASWRNNAFDCPRLIGVNSLWTVIMLWFSVCHHLSSLVERCLPQEQQTWWSSPAPSSPQPPLPLLSRFKTYQWPKDWYDGGYFARWTVIMWFSLSLSPSQLSVWKGVCLKSSRHGDHLPPSPSSSPTTPSPDSSHTSDLKIGMMVATLPGVLWSCGSLSLSITVSVALWKGVCLKSSRHGDRLSPPPLPFYTPSPTHQWPKDWYDGGYPARWTVIMLWFSVTISVALWKGVCLKSSRPGDHLPPSPAHYFFPTTRALPLLSPFKSYQWPKDWYDGGGYPARWTVIMWFSLSLSPHLSSLVERCLPQEQQTWWSLPSSSPPPRLSLLSWIKSYQWLKDWYDGCYPARWTVIMWFSLSLSLSVTISVALWKGVCLKSSRHGDHLPSPPPPFLSTPPLPHTRDLKIAMMVATLPGAWHLRTGARSCWPHVISMLWLGEIASLIFSFCITVAACAFVSAHPSARYTFTLLRAGQQTYNQSLSLMIIVLTAWSWVKMLSLFLSLRVILVEIYVWSMAVKCGSM